MTKILLIDDLRNFRFVPEGTEVVAARTSAEALAVLADEQTHWDEIWFDHDLGEPNGADPDTTMPVVDYLSERAFFGNPVSVGKVFIHSSNPPGVRQMAASLTRFGYAPTVVAPEPIFIVDGKDG